MVITRPHATGRRASVDTLRASVDAARALEAAGRRIARLDIGEPHFSTPAHIVDAAYAAMRNGDTKYVAPQGLLALRDAIAADCRTRGIVTAADEIVVTSGAKPMLLYALVALVSTGDEVLVPDPGYPGYAAAATLAGARVARYPIVRQHGGFAIDVDGLRAAITSRSRVLVLNSPHNPTGMVLDSGALEAAASIALEHDLWVVSDEIYRLLTYDSPPPPSIGALPGMRQRTVIVDGFSKAYAMTGWRLGYGVVPSALTTRITSLVAESATCTPAFVQQAGLAALAGPQSSVAEMRSHYRRQRDILVRRLVDVGFDVSVPAGALYAFADAHTLMGRLAIDTSVDLANALLHHHHVACVPGSSFGARGERHLRLAFAVAPDQLQVALERLAVWREALLS